MKKTTAEWHGDDLFIHWFGVKAEDYEVAAWWRGGSRPGLIYEGLNESKAWKLAEKPSAEEALRLIMEWQMSY